MLQKTRFGAASMSVVFATSLMDLMFETTPHQGRFQVCGFTTKGGFGFNQSW